ncbi:MAG: N-acetyltransferase [Flavobacterium sp.]|uniref:GNAT family N-acetyltransferase n=1 Tax=Flavobacterium sp. TaxID=239 RepID=UPI000C400BC1|nr:GNAT family N-acetyltransferase [Flavobacterium sp.]MBF04332.1 N-acetyltransferase [Flavobacterium sp.]|tara:strand:- start:827 stop:1501 length:675 start_codon:yes stop_codon:yes gene_type:complete
MQFTIEQASEKHLHYAEAICNEMEASAKVRGTGIAKRSPEYLQKKMIQGNAIIAITETGNWAGFCYIEVWSHEKFVANSGLIVSPEFREFGLAKRIKQAIFKLSRSKYPNSKIFGLTTGLAVMKINSDLGYEPVTYSELTQDEDFWKGCTSCINYEILISKDRKNCMCTAMIWDPVEKEKDKKLKIEQKVIAKERLSRMKKKHSLLKILSMKFKKKSKTFLNLI